MNNTALFDPSRLLKALCLLVLIFIPINMLVSPIFDFFTVQERGTNWTVTMSTFVFLLSSMLFFAMAVFFLKSRGERIFIVSAVAFFVYAFAYSIYMATDLFYPIYGLISVLGATIVGIMFYVSVRDGIISPKVVLYFLASASVLIAVPIVLVQIDPARYAELAEKAGASNILYGYENPRAVGWTSTICLSMLAAFLSTQPKEKGLKPVFLALVFVAATSLFWSGSRGGIIAFTLSFSVIFLLSQTKNYKGLISVLCCIAAGSVIAHLFYLPSKAFGLFVRVSTNLEQESVAAMSNGRTELWNLTASYILERPLTGFGFLPHKYLEGFTHGSAHNIVLDSWLWFGVIIGTAVLLLGLLLLVTAFQFFRKANDPVITALFCVVTTLCVYSMVSGPYARTFPMLLFAISCGVIFGRRSSQTTRATT